MNHFCIENVLNILALCIENVLTILTLSLMTTKLISNNTNDVSTR